MAQKQGNSSASEGRLGGQIGTLPVAGGFALGAGWGTTASLAVTAGSTDQRGSCTITSAGTGQAQATATVVATFIDGSYAATPGCAIVHLTANTNGITEAQPMGQAVTTTTLSWTHSVLPVATKTYTFSWIVIA